MINIDKTNILQALKFINDAEYQIESYFAEKDIYLSCIFRYLDIDEMFIELISDYSIDNKFIITTYGDGECCIEFKYTDKNIEEFSSTEEALEFLVNYIHENLKYREA